MTWWASVDDTFTHTLNSAYHLQPDCHLHLHLRWADNPYVSGTVHTKDSAPGLIMGAGESPQQNLSFVINLTLINTISVSGPYITCDFYICKASNRASILYCMKTWIVEQFSTVNINRPHFCSGKRETSKLKSKQKPVNTGITLKMQG